jgi:hypothetical protein
MALICREIGPVVSMIGVIVAVLVVCLCAAVSVALRDADPDVREIARGIIEMILDLLPRGGVDDSTAPYGPTGQAESMP